MSFKKYPGYIINHREEFIETYKQTVEYVDVIISNNYLYPSSGVTWGVGALGTSSIGGNATKEIPYVFHQFGVPSLKLLQPYRAVTTDVSDGDDNTYNWDKFAGRTNLSALSKKLIFCDTVDIKIINTEAAFLTVPVGKTLTIDKVYLNIVSPNSPLDSAKLHISMGSDASVINLCNQQTHTLYKEYYQYDVVEIPFDLYNFNDNVGPKIFTSGQVLKIKNRDSINSTNLTVQPILEGYYS